MDIYIARSAILVTLFICFIIICVWAYLRHQEEHFNEAAQLPFKDEDQQYDLTYHSVSSRLEAHQNSTSPIKEDQS